MTTTFIAATWHLAPALKSAPLPPNRQRYFAP